MKYLNSWKPLLIVGGMFLVAALACQVQGNSDTAAALVVCAVGDILFGVILMMIQKAKAKITAANSKVFVGCWLNVKVEV